MRTKAFLGLAVFVGALHFAFFSAMRALGTSPYAHKPVWKVGCASVFMGLAWSLLALFSMWLSNRTAKHSETRKGPA